MFSANIRSDTQLPIVSVFFVEPTKVTFSSSFEEVAEDEVEVFELEGEIVDEGLVVEFCDEVEVEVEEEDTEEVEEEEAEEVEVLSLEVSSIRGFEAVVPSKESKSFLSSSLPPKTPTQSNIPPRFILRVPSFPKRL